MIYYDTCVFGNALNPAHPESADCSRLIDAMQVSWHVALCPDLICAESTYATYVDAFEVDCALNGVIVNSIAMAAAVAQAKVNRAHKKALASFGLQDHDWKHTNASLAAGAKVLTTTDEDFIDPANKGGKKGGRRVAAYLRKNLDLEIALPSTIA